MIPDGGALTVTELTQELRGVLGATFGEVVVRGEVSQPRRVQSGHVYLTLKDAGAVLPAVIWRGTVARLRLAPEEGMEVLARGGIDVYPPHGRYQLVIRHLEAVGAGALQRAFEQLRQRLEAEGLFAPERKRALPVLPRRIALVTSRTGAAVRDLVRVLHARHPGADLVLVATRVQGAGSAEEIARALALADARAHADVVIVARGGGSLEDLWAFNEEIVARAIAACRTPVVSAVGHETDVTIADLVADVRAATPSHAGELVAPVRAELRRVVQREGTRLAHHLRTRVEHAWQRLEALAERPVLRSPYARLERMRAQLDAAAQRMRVTAPVAVRARRARVEALEGRLRALSPLGVLGRGYSLTTDAGGHVVHGVAQAPVGSRLTTRLGDGGEVTSRVEVVHPPAP